MMRKCRICNTRYEVKAHNPTELFLLPQACGFECFKALMFESIKKTRLMDKAIVIPDIIPFGSFRSELERDVYKLLQRCELEIAYEAVLYQHGNISYLPDFTVTDGKPSRKVITIEAKGRWQNNALKKVLDYRKFLHHWNSEIFVITRPEVRRLSR